MNAPGLGKAWDGKEESEAEAEADIFCGEEEGWREERRCEVMGRTRRLRMLTVITVLAVGSAGIDGCLARKCHSR